MMKYSKPIQVKYQQMPVSLDRSRMVKSSNTAMLISGNIPSQGERRRQCPEITHGEISEFRL